MRTKYTVSRASFDEILTPRALDESLRPRPRVDWLRPLTAGQKMVPVHDLVRSYSRELTNWQLLPLRSGRRILRRNLSDRILSFLQWP